MLFNRSFHGVLRDIHNVQQKKLDNPLGVMIRTLVNLSSCKILPGFGGAMLSIGSAAGCEFKYIEKHATIYAYYAYLHCCLYYNIFL